MFYIRFVHEVFIDAILAARGIKDVFLDFGGRRQFQANLIGERFFAIAGFAFSNCVNNSSTLRWSAFKSAIASFVFWAAIVFTLFFLVVPAFAPI